MNFKICNDLKINLPEVDTLFIEISKSVMNTHTHILIGVCYLPPHVKTAEFIEKLDELLNHIKKENCLTYFSGDFNVSTLNLSPCTNNIAYELQNTFYSYNYQPLIIVNPTRVNEETGTITLIGNIYVNETKIGTQKCHSVILNTKIQTTTPLLLLLNLIMM